METRRPNEMSAGGSGTGTRSKTVTTMSRAVASGTLGIVRLSAFAWYSPTILSSYGAGVAHPVSSIGTEGEAIGVPILTGVDARARLGDADGEAAGETPGDAMGLAH